MLIGKAFKDVFVEFSKDSEITRQYYLVAITNHCLLKIDEMHIFLPLALLIL